MNQYEKQYYEIIIREIPKISKYLKEIVEKLEDINSKNLWFKTFKFSSHHLIWKTILSVLNHIKIINFHTITYKKNLYT